MTLTIDAEDAWWPPTFTPDGVARTRLAWWTIDVASHSTRRWSASSTSSEGSAAAVPCGAASVLITPHSGSPGATVATQRARARYR